jgi:hypothetical protein
LNRFIPQGLCSSCSSCLESCLQKAQDSPFHLLQTFLKGSYLSRRRCGSNAFLASRKPWVQIPVTHLFKIGSSQTNIPCPTLNFIFLHSNYHHQVHCIFYLFISPVSFSSLLFPHKA